MFTAVKLDIISVSLVCVVFFREEDFRAGWDVRAGGGGGGGAVCLFVSVNQGWPLQALEPNKDRHCSSCQPQYYAVLIPFSAPVFWKMIHENPSIKISPHPPFSSPTEVQDLELNQRTVLINRV